MAAVAAFAIFAAGAALFLKWSNAPPAETARSFLATNWPGLFGNLHRLPDRRLADRLAESGFSLGEPVLIRIFKEEGLLELWMKRSEKFELAANYRICAWSGALGPKLAEGDLQSPEGYYFVSHNNLNPHSRFYRGINIGFPNAYDASYRRTGTATMIHGSCISTGCYAMTDKSIDDIYTAVVSAQSNGEYAVPLHIYPFRMTAENLERHRINEWANFWQNLAEGDKVFMATGLPPAVSVCGGRYEFGASSKDCTSIVSW